MLNYQSVGLRTWRRLPCLAVAVLTLFALAGPSWANDQVPFKARAAGSVVSASPCLDDPTLLCQVVVVSGTATHLGSFTAVLNDRVDPATFAFTGMSIFTASNGDTFRTEYVGQAFPTAIPGVVALVVTHTIVGGTGRFENATGSFVGIGFASLITGEVGIRYEGTISSPGSNKKR